MKTSDFSKWSKGVGGYTLPAPDPVVLSENPAGGEMQDLSKRLAAPENCVCGGRLWIGGDFPPGHPDFGKVVMCACERARQEKNTRQLRWNDSGILNYVKEGTLISQSFSSYSDEANPDCVQGKRYAISWSQDNPDAKPWLVLQGKTGIGKTHLAIAATAAAIGAGQQAVFVTATEFASRARREAKDGTLDTYLTFLKNAECLILDDLGREYKTDFSIDIVFEVLDFRYFNWKRTLTTTNHTMEELATIFGEPMRSRLMDTNRSRFVNMTGKDIRRFGA